LISEVQPEVFAASTGGQQHPIGEPIGQVGRSGDVTTGDARAAQLHLSDSAPGDVVGQSAPDDLDLRELRHSQPRP
jgi:hypothetical protein